MLVRVLRPAFWVCSAARLSAKKTRMNKWSERKRMPYRYNVNAIFVVGKVIFSLQRNICRERPVVSCYVFPQHFLHVTEK